MTSKGGANKACAACKFQRRRCSKDCILSPYFPADKPKTFSNAHRLFGVCNMIRILNRVKPDERDEAMKSIIFESDMRERFPVYGCYGVMLHYQNLLARATQELRDVQMLLAYFKQQSQQRHRPLPLPTTDQCNHAEVFQPSCNHAEFSLFNGNVAYDDSGFYDESKDNCMNKCSFSNTAHVRGNSDENPNSMSIHQQSMDAKPLKPVSRQVQVSQSYHNENQTYRDDSWMNNLSCNAVSADPMDANSNLKEKSLEEKSSKLKSIAKQGRSCHNEYNIFYYDQAPFDEFDSNRQSFIECKDACE